MIRMYCQRKHRTKSGLCPECAELDTYAREHSDQCPFMEKKTFCFNCQVHCYQPDMRERICRVMRYSAPRMIFHRPMMTIHHVFEMRKERKSRIKRDLL